MNDRDCENCIHKVNGACNVWDCKFEPKEDEPFEPCEDAISRQAAIDAIKNYASMLWEKYHEPFPESTIMEMIQELPSVTPQPKAGHWIKKEGREQGYDIAGIKTWYIQIMCDKCGFIKTAIEERTGQYHFCPNCGSKMESEET